MKQGYFKNSGSDSWKISGIDLWQWWRQAQQEAIAHQIPLEEVDWLVLALTNLTRLDLRLGTFREREAIALSIPPADLPDLWHQRLADRVPVQYLVGIVPWRNFELQVSPAVLIPRPETEYLIDLVKGVVEKSASDRPNLASGHWADLGTGSGAIALGLAQALPQAQIHAVDYSPAALAIAQSNAQTYDLTGRIHFYQGSWFEPLTHLKGSLSGMVSNPPYIPHQQIFDLQPEVVRHEPHLALDGGEDGLTCIRVLVESAPIYLQSGGWWLVELMAGQAERVVQLLEDEGSYQAVAIAPDLAGIERFVMTQRL